MKNKIFFTVKLSLLIIFLLNQILVLKAQQWTNYTAANSDLAGDIVWSIATDTQNNIWFGTGNGISKFDGTNWTTYTTANGLVDNTVTSIAIDSQGNKWFGTHNGVSKFDGVNWTNYTTVNSGLPYAYVHAIAIDSQGNKWFGISAQTTSNGTNAAVSKFDGTNWTTYTTANGLVFNFVTLKGIYIDSQDNKWFGTGGGFGTSGGVSKFDGTTWTNYTTANSGLADNNVYGIAIDTQGNKWFGTNGSGHGVSKFDGTNWTTYTTANGLISNLIDAIAVDNQDNKWFGTGNGISKFDGTTWTNYTTANGLVQHQVLSIAIDAQCNKWFGTYGGVSKLSYPPSSHSVIVSDTTYTEALVPIDTNVIIKTDTLIGVDQKIITTTDSVFISIHLSSVIIISDSTISVTDQCGSSFITTYSDTTTKLTTSYDTVIHQSFDTATLVNTGFKATNLSQNIVIYPNPFTKELSINIGDGDADITLSDALGRLILQTKCIDHLVIYPDVLSGVYFLKLVCKNKPPTTIKVMAE